MERTWRWFGKNDPITLKMLRQIGVEGIVTALHSVPNGEIWSVAEISDLKRYIEKEGLRWSVVESLPVCESIKYGGDDRDHLIENYKKSLTNLGRCGIKTICYNFMPVIDWIRTDLFHPWPDGTSSLYFDKSKFAYFDCMILKRAGAEKDYTEDELRKVAALDRVITEKEKDDLVDNIIVKTQGFVNGNIREGDNNPVMLFRKLLKLYDGISKDQLRSNMKYFLEQIMPVCDEYGINMCVHPDDPPYQVLGLPRIVTCEDDIDWFLGAVDNVHNGLTFCAGSLSSGIQNDVPRMAAKYLSRTHFVHLRSTEPDAATGNFIESPHISGKGKLTEIIPIFLKGREDLPFRVDHGKCMLGDDSKNYNPGYSFYGRMYALAEVIGMIAMAEKK